MTKNQSPKKAQNIKIKKDWSLDDPNFWSEMNTNMSKFKNNDQFQNDDECFLERITACMGSKAFESVISFWQPLSETFRHNLKSVSIEFHNVYNTLTNELSKKEQDDIKNILKMVIDMFDRFATPIKEIINMLPNSLQKLIKDIWQTIRNLSENFLKFYFALHYNLRHSLKKLKKPSEYNAFNLNLSETLHNFAFALIPPTEEFNAEPFSILQSRIKKLKKYYGEKDYQTSFIYVTQITDGLLKINYNTFNPTCIHKFPPMQKKLDALFNKNEISAFPDPEIIEGVSKIWKYRNNVVHGEYFDHIDKNLVTIHMYIMVMIYALVKYNTATISTNKNS